jgi:serine/threonine protein kinase
MTAPPDCPTLNCLERLLNGTLAAPEAEPVRAHLHACALCQSALDRLTDSEQLATWADGQPVAGGDLAESPGFLHWMARQRTERSGAATDSDPPSSSQSSAGAVPSSSPPEEGARLGDYSIEEELGHGGMGIVYRAFDPSLKRRVAIKILRPERADATARRRLVREAQAAARFRHDNVVTVHAVVDPPDGLPYLVMEYVAGATLGELVRGSPGRRGGMPPRQAAELIAQIADGLAAAHQVGLVHRDIKPDNVMIEPASGRPKLMDFGLARGQGDLGHLTREDIVAGTPSYMSPEQARCEQDLDPRSDLYALGVTLYETLTGEVPFRGAPQMVLRQIFEEDPRPPRQLNDRIPRDLETICLKAMAKVPLRRYPSAGDMAADLRRWLSGEPVHARPTGPVERLISRARRNPKITALSVALLAVLFGGVAGIIWQWSQAERFRARAENERDEAMRQRAQAARGFRRAREAVDQYLTEVSEDQELKSENLDVLRRKLLQTARDFYERFLSDHPDDPELAAELGRAQGRLGSIVMELDSIAQGVPHYQRKREIFQQLHNQKPDDPGYRHELAESHLQLGWSLTFAGLSDDAEAEYNLARDLWSALLREQPENDTYALYLARAHGNLGVLDQYRLGRFQRAEAHDRDSLEILERLLRKQPGDIKFRNEMAGILHRLGEIYGETNRLEPGIAALRKAVDLRTAVVRDSPRNGIDRARLGNDLIALGDLHDRVGQVDDAAQAWARAFDHIQQAMRDHPAQTLFRQAFGEINELLGRMAVRGKSSPEVALRHLETARETHEALMLASPNDAEMLYNLQKTYVDLFFHHLVFGQPQRGLAVFDRAIKTFEPAASDTTGETPKYQWMLADIHMIRGDALQFLNRPVESMRDYDLALKLTKDPALRAQMSRRHSMAEGLQAVGNGDVARARTIALEAARAEPKNGEVLYAAAALLAACAAATDPARNATAREQLIVQALDLLRQARDTHYLSPLALRSILSVDPSYAAIRKTKPFEQFLAELPAPK